MPDYKKMQKRHFTFTQLLRIIEKKEATDKFPALIPIGNALRKKMDKINSTNWHESRTKSSDVKKEMRHKLAQAAWHVSCGIYSFAHVTGNAALRNAVKYSLSDFYRPVESTMIGRVGQVLNAVKKVKNPEYYGLLPEVIGKLQEELKKYLEFMEKPVLNVKRHSRIARLVERLLDQCLNILHEQLDPLMVVISCTDKELSKTYNIWRKIDKPAGRKRKYIKKKKPDQQDLVLAPNLIENKSLSSEIENIIGKEKTLNFEP